VNLLVAEPKCPQVYVNNAFKIIYWRFFFFYIAGAVSVGVLVAYNDPILVFVFITHTDTGTTASSPFNVAMQNLKVERLSHLTELVEYRV
jgi:amino acid transporter